MMALVKSDEGSNRTMLSPLNDLMETFFNDSYMTERRASRVPAVNICELDNEYHFELAAPGLKKEDFRISLGRNMLNISVEKRTETSEANKRYNKREFSYTSFVRSFALPDSADDAQIEAQYINGILDIKVAKKEEAHMAAREIQIK